MANERISTGFPFAVFVNELELRQRIAPGVYVNETAGPFVVKTEYLRRIKKPAKRRRFAVRTAGVFGTVRPTTWTAKRAIRLKARRVKPRKAHFVSGAATGSGANSAAVSDWIIRNRRRRRG